MKKSMNPLAKVPGKRRGEGPLAGRLTSTAATKREFKIQIRAERRTVAAEVRRLAALEAQRRAYKAPKPTARKK